MFLFHNNFLLEIIKQITLLVLCFISADLAYLITSRNLCKNKL